MRRREPQDFTQVRMDGRFGLAESAAFRNLPQPVRDKRHFFDPAVDSRFLKRFESCGLGVCQSPLRSTLGERPASPPRAHQKKFNAGAENPETYRGDLYARLCPRLVFQGCGRRTDQSNLPCTHAMRLHDWIDND